MERAWSEFEACVALSGVADVSLRLDSHRLLNLKHHHHPNNNTSNCTMTSNTDARPRTLCLFDVDGTLSLARQQATPEMISFLASLREKVHIGFCGGSNLPKILEQLQLTGKPDVLQAFDWGFAENGLTAYKDGAELESQSFVAWLGEEKYKKLVKFCLRYISELDLPIMR